jgi:hypothetical protein
MVAKSRQVRLTLRTIIYTPVLPFCPLDFAGQVDYRLVHQLYIRACWSRIGSTVQRTLSTRR